MKPKRTAFCMANNAQVLETLCGDADLIAFDLAYVTKVPPGTVLTIEETEGRLEIEGKVKKNVRLTQSFNAWVEHNPQMMVGWSRSSIKEELCRCIDRMFDQVEREAN